MDTLPTRVYLLIYHIIKMADISLCRLIYRPFLKAIQLAEEINV